MSEEKTPVNTRPNALQRMFRLLCYIAGIGLLLFLLFTIAFSLWSIVKTA
jgi:hypothetical protein